MNNVLNLTIYPNSIHNAGRLTCFLAWNQVNGQRLLGTRLEGGGKPKEFTGPVLTSAGDTYFALNAENAVVLRRIFPWLNAVPLEPASAAAPQQVSFGFGDRLGLATPGHIKALHELALPVDSIGIAPIFAQQSVRENTRTGRTPRQVMDDALWGVFQEGWRLPWGADADHLKQVSDLPPFVEAGYSFFTVDPGEHVDPAADSDPEDVLLSKISSQAWDEIEGLPLTTEQVVERYLGFCHAQDLTCDPEQLRLSALRAAAKYGRAVLHMIKMYRALCELKPGGFDFEVSVDETDSPTTTLEHFYIASSLKHFQVRMTSLAPRLPGRFEKGVDYIGDLAALEVELAHQAAVLRHLGGYKLSLHSGSDKFSLYPLLVRLAGRAVHVKTAGTSYLEALRAAAQHEPALFRQILELACLRYAEDRRTYHVSAEQERLPDASILADEDLPGLLEDFDVRQALHVTFGSALAQYEQPLKIFLSTHPETYLDVLKRHFGRHLQPLANLQP
jgi:tagaturonate epimerase